MAIENRPCGNKQSYIGTQLAISPIDREPVLSDVVGDIVSIGEIGAAMSTIDSTPVSDTSGFTSNLPSNRTWNPVAVTVFTTGANLNRLYQQFFANNPTEDSVYVKLVVVMPKRSTWENTPVPVLQGFLSSFNFGSVDLNSAQQFTFEFTPCGAPGVFNGFANVTSITAAPASLQNTGGEVTYTVEGENLIDGLMVKGFVNNTADVYTIGRTTGTSTSQTAQVTFPANETDQPKDYVIKVSLDGGNTYETATTTVTVAAVGA